MKGGKQFKILDIFVKETIIFNWEERMKMEAAVKTISMKSSAGRRNYSSIKVRRVRFYKFCRKFKAF